MDPQAGLPCTTVELYRQIPLSPTLELLEAAQGTAPLLVPVFSPRSAQALVLPDRTAPLHIVAISAEVARAVQGLGAKRILTADRPDADHMQRATKTALQDLSRPSAA